MEVLRKVSIEVNEGEQYYVGDQITVRMKELGNFTATVQAIEEDSVVFMFDDIITKHNHNDIQEWLDKDILPLFPETFNVTEIPVGSVENLTIMTGMDEETSEEFEQAVIETVNGEAYSTCSMSAVTLIDELIDMIDGEECRIADIGFTFEKITTKNGNNCCICSLI